MRSSVPAAAKTASSDAIIGTGKNQVLLVGAIDSIDSAASTITVLGRTLKLPTVLKVESALAAGHQLMVAVSGRISTTGSVDQMKLRVIPTEYVAGSTEILLSGRVSSVDTSVGTMKVGGVTIDISSALASKTPTPGNLVMIVGSQPVRQGLVIATKMFVK